MKRWLPYLLGSILLISACNKKITSTFGQFDKSYSCLGMLPIYSDTTFSPAGDMLSGYLGLEMYRSGFKEVFGSDEFTKTYAEEGKVYFPRRFNRALATEYSMLLGMDGVLFGQITSPVKTGSDIKGPRKLTNIELYFLDVPSSEIIWSYSTRTYIKPGQYNADLRSLSAEVVRNLKEAGLTYDGVKMPCWDNSLSAYLRMLPDLSREMFNSLSYDLAESQEDNLAMELGNIFMTIGKRDIALAQYRSFLRENPTSPFKGEVEQQVATLEKRPK